MPALLGNVLTELESLTREMAGAEGVPLETLDEMMARRKTLVDKVAALRPLDASARERIGGIVRMGAAIDSHLGGIRESLRQEIASVGRARCFAEELSRTIPFPAHRLNTRG